MLNLVLSITLKLINLCSLCYSQPRICILAFYVLPDAEPCSASIAGLEASIVRAENVTDVLV